MENFKSKVRLMLCKCCCFDRPNRVLKQAVLRAVDRTSKTTLNFSKHYVKLFCKPLK